MELFGPSLKYSQYEHQITEYELKKILGHVHLTPGSSVSSADMKAVERALLFRRGNDGAISLQQIYETLLKLKNQNIITIYDYEALFEAFKQYFNEHFER